MGWFASPEAIILSSGVLYMIRQPTEAKAKTGRKIGFQRESIPASVVFPAFRPFGADAVIIRVCPAGLCPPFDRL